MNLFAFRTTGRELTGSVSPADPVSPDTGLALLDERACPLEGIDEALRLGQGVPQEGGPADYLAVGAVWCEPVSAREIPVR